MLGELDLVIAESDLEACLIELKAVFISDAHAAHLDRYNDALQEKYGSGRKGIGQLARAIGLLAGGGLDELPPELARATTLRPLVVVADPYLDAPGHAEFLRREFVAALEPSEQLTPRLHRKGGLTVAAPVILTIDDFEWLAASLVNFRLSDFLRDCSEQAGEMDDVRDFVFRSQYQHGMRNPAPAMRAARALIAEMTELADAEPDLAVSECGSNSASPLLSTGECGGSRSDR